MKVPRVRWPVAFTHEYLIVRRNGEDNGPYRNEVDARRDFGQWRGAALYRRWVIRPVSYRLVESKPWDAA